MIEFDLLQRMEAYCNSRDDRFFKLPLRGAFLSFPWRLVIGKGAFIDPATMTLFIPPDRMRLAMPKLVHLREKLNSAGARERDCYKLLANYFYNCIKENAALISISKYRLLRMYFSDCKELGSDDLLLRLHMLLDYNTALQVRHDLAISWLDQEDLSGWLRIKQRVTYYFINKLHEEYKRIVKLIEKYCDELNWTHGLSSDLKREVFEVQMTVHFLEKLSLQELLASFSSAEGCFAKVNEVYRQNQHVIEHSDKIAIQQDISKMLLQVRLFLGRTTSLRGKKMGATYNALCRQFSAYDQLDLMCARVLQRKVTILYLDILRARIAERDTKRGNRGLGQADGAHLPHIGVVLFSAAHSGCKVVALNNPAGLTAS